jgi:hypothetical protein
VTPQKRQEPLREGWYRNVSVRMWGDEKFRRLSQDAKFLWLYLLTGPHTTVLPGLFALGKASLAEELDWATDRLVTAFGELESFAMARADWSARVVWLVKAGKHNRPDNPNVVIAWRNVFVVIPESPVKDEAEKAFMELLECRGAAYVEAFKRQSWRPSGEPYPKPFGKPYPKQDQDQDQQKDQRQEREQETDQHQKKQGADRARRGRSDRFVPSSKPNGDGLQSQSANTPESIESVSKRVFQHLQQLGASGSAAEIAQAIGADLQAVHMALNTGKQRGWYANPQQGVWALRQ